jgi:hypothetical protein
MKKMHLTPIDIKQIGTYVNKFSDVFYPQLAHIDAAVKPMVFYSSIEKYTSKIENNVPVPEYFSIDFFRNQLFSDQGKYYNCKDSSVIKILKFANEVFDDAKKYIDCASSFFILIEGKLQDSAAERVYNHYHPARGTNQFCLVSTYISAGKHVTPTSEYFSYADFNKIGVSPPVAADLATMTPKNIAETITHFSNLPDLEWRYIKFPEEHDEVLKIDFDAHRYAHNVTSLTENIWAIFVFNDVKYIGNNYPNSNGINFTVY